MVDTFEKMDAINPTFDLEGRFWYLNGRVMKIRFMYFPTLTIYSGLSHLFNKRIPILTELNCLCAVLSALVMAAFLEVAYDIWWSGWSCFEHTQILTQLVWHLTTNYLLDDRCAPLYISIFTVFSCRRCLVGWTLIWEGFKRELDR